MKVSSQIKQGKKIPILLLHQQHLIVTNEVKYSQLVPLGLTRLPLTPTYPRPKNVLHAPGQ